MNFESKAASYESVADVQREAAAALAQWLEIDLSSYESLELGAGTGLFTRHLLARGAPIEATDLSPAMLEQARTAFPEASWSQLDAWQPAINRPAVDRLYACSLLQWAPDASAVLQQWGKLIRPGGVLLTSTFIEPTLCELRTLAPELKSLPWRSEVDWLKAYREAGWEILRSDSQTHTVRYSNALDLLRCLHRSGATLGPQLSAGRLRSLLRRYETAHRDAEGVYASWQSLRVEARRL